MNDMNQLTQGKGYVVVPVGYTSEELNILHTSMQTDILNIVFGSENQRKRLLKKRQFSLTSSNPETWKLFTDVKLRKQVFKEPHKIWKPRNHPLSRSCGMIDIHHNPDIHRMVLFDQRMYNILSQAYGKQELVHSAGPEKFSIKPPNATDMNKHIDANLWHEENNYPERIQSFLAVSVPTQGEWRDRGGLCVLKNFHHYWDFASCLFHYEFGLYPMPKTTSRFHVLPKNFDNYFLPRLRETAQQYSQWLNENKRNFDPDLVEFFTQIQDYIIIPREYNDKPIEWEYVEYQAGDVVMWNQHLPHFSARNNTDELRSVIYYSVFPVDHHWFSMTRQQTWTLSQFENNTFHYEVQATIYSYNIKNSDEYKYRTEHGLTQVYKETELSRRMSGLESWFS